ncbi:hypothetical protein VCSRO83_0632 [Vibrio cholerae]|nr:hypothetical protein VCSRO83_0632 [Vibrio cholerae]
MAKRCPHQRCPHHREKRYGGGFVIRQYACDVEITEDLPAFFAHVHFSAKL